MLKTFTTLLGIHPDYSLVQNDIKKPQTDRQPDSQTMFVYSDHKKITKISQNTLIDHKWSLETHIKAIAAVMRATNSIILTVQIF